MEALGSRERIACFLIGSHLQLTFQKSSKEEIAYG